MVRGEGGNGQLWKQKLGVREKNEKGERKKEENYIKKIESQKRERGGE